ncbi:hypothetical protein [Streptomyces stelliscabiei]|uniref:hypothetical protein n=1 Tax=Streptomyces stelliscabiei TaxID=146820 RepID=UPI0029B1D0E1|nr:hypothetical protein [Streptomyces stelliscabiei]MDX2557244.1 hypothetical protein [Streptomyces stelliscabiei]MDX2616366.1 hypothetical protein [Streptomyces stelliscabiei]MDX2641067.1 hypothetical protein [Streptomyces stelliscabiei]MDX2665129.1 hypothetical protein [Streptomyces stelliscabiei]MDX2716196.1 hypothetical protein [Streptomyces stelliscabiei]
MSPARRRARLALPLTGLAIVITGIIIWGQADIDSGVADQAATNASAADHAEVLGFEVDYQMREDRWQASADKRIAEEDKTFGLAVATLGAGIFASRWAIKPAT